MLIIILLLIIFVAIFSSALLRIGGSSAALRKKFLFGFLIFSLFIFLSTGFLRVTEYLSLFLILPLIIILGNTLIKKSENPRAALISVLLGLAWCIISYAPYMIMVGGYIDPPVLIKIITLPAWISINISDFLFGLSLNTKNLFFNEYLYQDIYEQPLFFLLPFVIGGLIGFICYRIYSMISKPKIRQAKIS